MKNVQNIDKTNNKLKKCQECNNYFCEKHYKHCEGCDEVFCMEKDLATRKYGCLTCDSYKDSNHICA